MMWQTGPADTLDFMLLGYAVILGVMALYVLYLWIRFRSTAEDDSVLRDALEGDDQIHGTQGASS